MQEKQNDWLVSTLNQPDFSIQDFTNIGLNHENTELKDRDFYKSKKYFQDQFVNEDGVFDEKAFDKKYDQMADAFKVFAHITSENDFLDRAEFNYNNIWASDKAKRFASDFKFEAVKNPFRSITGTEGVNSKKDGGLSLYEVAQQNKLRDSEGNILDETANELGVFGTIFNKNTYVMDAWEEDGEHLEDGKLVKHYKGETKYDEEGDPYLRAIRPDEDLSGKKVLNWTDVITEDGSTWNKWDAFDSDGKDVGIGRTVIKSALKVAPLMAGLAGAPVIATGYAGITAALALGQTLPSVVKAIDGLINKNDGSQERNTLWKTMNAIEGWSNRFKGSVTDNSQENMITFENFAGLLTDVGMQLSQQKFIAQIPKWLKMDKGITTEAEMLSAMGNLRKTAMANYVRDREFNAASFIQSGMKELMESQGKEIANFQNVSKSLSSTYMAITSAGDAWASAKDSGHDERTAGIITLGTMAGLYGLMRYTDVGDWAIKNVGLEETRTGVKAAVKEAIKDMSDAWTGKHAKFGKEALEKGIFNKVKNSVNAFTETLRNGTENQVKDLLTKSLAEGIEEVTEETIGDGMNMLANMGAFGETSGKYDFSVKDFASRYGMAFFGGAIGGAVHVGIEKLDPNQTHKSLDKQTRQELEYLTYKYGAEAVKQEIEKQYQKNLLPVSKVFSTNMEEDGEGNQTPKLATKEEESAAWHVKETLKNQIDSYQSILRGFTENSFDDDINKATLYSERMGQMLKLGSKTAIKNDYMDAVDDYISANIELAGLGDGNVPTNEQSRRRNEAAAKLDKFREGEYFENYAEMATFIMDSDLSAPFIGANKEMYSQIKYGKRVDELDEDQKKTLEENYDSYSKNDRNAQAKEAFELFKKVNSKFSPVIGKKMTQYNQVRKITESKVANFDKLLKVLHFSEEDLSDLEGLRHLGVMDPLAIEQFYEANNTWQKKNDALTKIEETLGLFTTGIDAQVATQIIDKLDNYIAGEQVPYKQIEASFMREDTNIINKNNKSHIPVGIKNALLVNPLEFDLNATKANILENLTTTDESSQFYISPEFLNNLSEDFKNNWEMELGVDFADIDWASEDGLNVLKTTFAETLDNSLGILVNPNKLKFIQRVGQVKDQIQNIQINPVYDILEEMNKMTLKKSSKILELLNEESKRLQSVQRIQEYVIEDPHRLKEVDTLLSNIEVARKLIGAASVYNEDYDKFGYNFFTNQVRAKFGKNTEILAELDQADAGTVLRDLEILETKLTYLRDLSNYNSSDKLKSHKRAAIKMQAMQYRNSKKMLTSILNNNSNSDKEFLEFKKIMNEGMDEILTSNIEIELDGDSQQFLNNFNILDDKRLIETESFISKYENKLYDNYQKFKLTYPNTDEMIAELLTTGTNTDRLLAEVTSELSENTNEMTEYNNILDFMTSLSIKNSDFKQVLLDSITSGKLKGAPVYGQEYPAKMAVASVLNPGLFNAFLDIQLKNASNKKIIPISLKNTFIIKGYAGSGKTSATANIIDAVLEATGTTRTATSILETQTENLKQSLGVTEGYTKSELLQMLNATNLKSHVDAKGGLKTSIQSIIDPLLPKDGVDPMGKLGKVIYIDEGTHYTSFEIGFLSEFARQSGRSLILFGDRLQKGASVNGKQDNLDHVFKIQSPTLEFSMRANNTHVKYNNDQVRTAANIVFKGLDDRLDLSKIRSDYKQNLNEIEFHYHEAPNVFTGHKMVDSITESDVNHLLKINEDAEIGYIYDDVSTDTYKLIKRMQENGAKIKMLHEDAVQGLELDHFIVDVDLSKVAEMDSHATKFHTAISRSRQGSIVLRNGSAVNSIDKGPAYITSLTEEMIAPFREQRVAVLTAVLDENPSSGEFAKLKENQKTQQTGQAQIQKGPQQGNQSSTPEIIPGLPVVNPLKLDEDTNALALAMVGMGENPLSEIEKAKDKAEQEGAQPTGTVYMGNTYDYMVYGNINNWGGQKEMHPSGKYEVLKRKDQVFKVINDNNKEVSYVRDMSGLMKGDVVSTDSDIIRQTAKKLSNLRTALLHYGSLEKLASSPHSNIWSDFYSVSGEEGLDADFSDNYDFENATFKFVLTHADPSRMRDIKGDTHHYLDSNGKYQKITVIPQIVFEAPSNVEGKPNLQITIADLHNQTVQNEFKDPVEIIKNNPGFTYEKDLGNDISNIIDAFSTSNSFIDNKTLTSRAKAINGAGATNGYITSLYDLDNDTRGMIISDPQIIGNVSIVDNNGEEINIFAQDPRNVSEKDEKGNPKRNEKGEIIYKKQMRGQQIVYISTDPMLTFPKNSQGIEEKVTSENLARYYENYVRQLENNKNKNDDELTEADLLYKPAVQWYPLSSSLTDNFGDYVNNYNKVITEIAKTKAAQKEVSTYFDPWHAGRMVMSLYENYAAIY